MPEYWGRSAAGLLFVCGNQILLTKRSQEVDNPGVWGIPGGSVSGESFYSSERRSAAEPISEEKTYAGALREASEELGNIPKFQVLDRVIYRDGGFTYTTYVVGISPLTKKFWQIQLNWENDEARWFSINRVPRNLHPGVQYLINML